MSDLEAVKVAKYIIPTFVDVAKSCIQLSVGVLTLSIGFREKVLGKIGSKWLWLLIFSYICFFISIVAGALYLHLAAKRITNYLSSDAARAVLEEWLPLSSPHWPYVVMGISFVFGVFFLVLLGLHSVYQTMREKTKNK